MRRLALFVVPAAILAAVAFLLLAPSYLHTRRNLVNVRDLVAARHYLDPDTPPLPYIDIASPGVVSWAIVLGRRYNVEMYLPSGSSTAHMDLCVALDRSFEVQWFIDTPLQSRVVLVLWKKEVVERGDLLRFSVTGDRLRVPCELVLFQKADVPADVREELAVAGVKSPPHVAGLVWLACPPGLRDFGTLEISLESPSIKGNPATCVARPNWGPVVCFEWHDPAVEGFPGWPPARRERYVTDRIMEMGQPFLPGFNYSTMQFTMSVLLSPAVERPLRLKVLDLVVALDPDRKILSSFAREKLARELKGD